MLKGIDISHWQGAVDWTKVTADFVIMKCSGGDNGLYKDVNFETYKKGARAKGIGIGYYHFAGGSDPIKEADFFISSVGDIATGEVLALDFEIRIADPVGYCEKFVQRIIDRVGFRPLFYSYSSLAALFKSGVVLDCGLWIADPQNPPRIGAWKTWAVHQYTIAPKGSYPGINAAVDQDYFNGDISQFKKYGKQAGTTPPVEPVYAPQTVLSQRDNRWADIKMGQSQSTVGRYGCTITALAAATAYFKQYAPGYKDPGFLARHLNFTSEGLVIWSSLPEQTCFKLEKRFYGQQDALIQEALKNPRKVVLIQVENYHWVLGLGRNLFGGYRIMDSWFGDQATTKRYKSITGGAVLVLK